MTTKSKAHRWQFKARFRRNAYGWRSQPAIKRVKEAVSEIKKVARGDQILGAEGAVSFLERVSPALENVDSSSGAIGTAVNKAIVELVKIISTAPADKSTREAWLERLFEAHAEDQIPYIEQLAEYWGELCASPELASRWADRLIDITRSALSHDKKLRGFFHGTTACLSSLFAAGRYRELADLLESERYWGYRRWAVKAMIAQGERAAAIRYAESCRGPWASDHEIDGFCEGVLLSSGLVDEAYERYGLQANRAGTYLAWFRAVAKKYPHKKASEILADLVELTPGEEGKWFAAAKSAKLFDEAIDLANRSPCAPQTLTRAARDFAVEKPEFAVEAGVAALRWLAEGYGYEVTSTDVLNAYSFTMKAAENAGLGAETHRRIRKTITTNAPGGSLVRTVLRRQLGLE